MQHFLNIFSMYNTLKIGAMEWIQAIYVYIHVVTLYIILLLQNLCMTNSHA